MLNKWQGRIAFTVFVLFFAWARKVTGVDEITWVEALIHSAIPATLGYFAGRMVAERDEGDEEVEIDVEEEAFPEEK